MFFSSLFVYSLAKTRHSWWQSLCKVLLTGTQGEATCHGTDSSAIRFPCQATTEIKRPWTCLFAGIDVAKSLQVSGHIWMCGWGIFLVLLVPRVQVTETSFGLPALWPALPQNMMSFSSGDTGIHPFIRIFTTQYLQIIKALETMIVDKLELCVMCHIFSDQKNKF